MTFKVNENHKITATHVTVCLPCTTTSDFIRYDTIEEFNVESKAEYTA